MQTRKLNKTEKEKMFDSLKERFGFKPEDFKGFDFLLASKNRVFITNDSIAKIFDKFDSASVGLLFARMDKSVKPSSNMIQVFGNKATKNVVELDEKQTKEYAEGLDLEIKKTDATDGYVILKYKNYPLGCGLLKNGHLKNQLPKGKRMNVEMM